MNGPDEYPGVRQRQAERNELMRVAAQSALDRSRGGKDLELSARRWALHWAAKKPLTVPLTEGEPV